MVTCPKCKTQSMEVVTECGEDFWLCHECNAEYDIEDERFQLSIKPSNSVEAVNGEIIL